MKIEVSNGELLDKISILEIKEGKLTDKSKRAYVQKELEYLQDIADELLMSCYPDYVRLSELNRSLWDTEDEIRAKGEKGEYDDRFIELSRFIYEKNDERARVKRDIDESSNSDFREQKGHRTV
tara:strand:- start:3207 stop:3578 length:372 start_codon:yes stop_codon:yes gene_type:complete